MPPARPATDRFQEKYAVDASGCWIWTGYRDPNGYGRFNLNGSAEWAHRASWQLYRGSIPQGLTLDHLCRVSACVNPDHLEPVTQYVNNRRGNAPRIVLSRLNRCMKGHDLSIEENVYRHSKTGYRTCRVCLNRWPLKDHCPSGHFFDAANTGRNNRGHRYCRACSRVRASTRYWAGRAAIYEGQA